MPSHSSKPADQGRTLARTAAILDAIAVDPGGADLTEVARSAGMSPSGAHRALRGLIALGMATQESPRGRYRLGPRIHGWARRMPDESLLLSVAEAELDVLSEATGETVVVSVLRDGRMWNLASREGRGVLVARSLHNGESNLHATARGLLFLAGMTREDAEILIRRDGLPALTAHTIVDQTELWRVVDDARRHRLAWSRDTAVLGGSGLASPILDSEGATVACLAVHLPSARLTPALCRELEGQVFSSARRIESAWALSHSWS